MCSCLYFNFIQEHLSFLFSTVSNSLYFFIFYPHLYLHIYAILVFIRVLLRLSKYTLYSKRIRNSVSGRKLNTIRLLISVILQDFND